MYAHTHTGKLTYIGGTAHLKIILIASSLNLSTTTSLFLALKSSFPIGICLVERLIHKTDINQGL